MSDFEEKMLYYASPALLGRKQANLFSFPICRLTDYRKEIETSRKELSPLGISVEYLYSRQQRVYLLIYRKDMLLQYLRQPAVKAFLIQEGYPPEVGEEASFDACLCTLRQHILEGNDFPHEIGFFFGYPPEDAGKLGKNLAFAVEFFTDIHILTNHSVMASYDDYTHGTTSFFDFS